MNCFVGITLAQNVSQEERAFFEDVLTSYNSLIFQANQTASNVVVKAPQAVNSVLRPTNTENKELVVISSDDEDEEKSEKKTKPIRPPPPALSKTEYISQSLISGAQYLSSGVQKGSEYASKYVKQGGEKLLTSIQPNE